MTFNILQIIFFTTLGIVLNTYLIYPLVITFISKFISEKESDKFFQPTISILIAAYNEEKVIKERLKNIAALNYDFSKIEVLVGSDNSTDCTNEFLSEFQKTYCWLRIFPYKERSGKAGVLNKLIKESQNEIIVFTDANTVFDKDALNKLISGFSSDSVGCVCGRLVLTDKSKVEFEGVEEEIYWKLETLIKRAEGKLGILIGANGGIFAIRKNLYSKIPTQKAVTDDLFISLQPLLKGYKVIYCEDALAFETVGKNITEEFNRKVRFSATNFQTFVYLIKLLSPFKPLTAYAFISHKVSRWFLPVIMVLLFFSNFFLLNLSGFFMIIFQLQVIFYSFALIGGVLAKFRIRLIPFSLFYFFLIANSALLIGLFRFILGKHSVIWERTSR